jgi:hypothetical protein
MITTSPTTALRAAGPFKQITPDPFSPGMA